jgi:hypothetical protein
LVETPSEKVIQGVEGRKVNLAEKNLMDIIARVLRGVLQPDGEVRARRGQALGH